MGLEEGRALVPAPRWPPIVKWLEFKVPMITSWGQGSVVGQPQLQCFMTLIISTADAWVSLFPHSRHSFPLLLARGCLLPLQCAAVGVGVPGGRVTGE